MQEIGLNFSIKPNSRIFSKLRTHRVILNTIKLIIMALRKELSKIVEWRIKIWRRVKCARVLALLRDATDQLLSQDPWFKLVRNRMWALARILNWCIRLKDHHNSDKVHPVTTARFKEAQVRSSLAFSLIWILKPIPRSSLSPTKQPPTKQTSHKTLTSSPRSFKRASFKKLLKLLVKMARIFNCSLRAQLISKILAHLQLREPKSALIQSASLNRFIRNSPRSPAVSRVNKMAKANKNGIHK